ncbi:hypothetical protein B0H10DRAFT_1947756 [Mycena sp. CBHHK59/15]|nr:hypothetical protein B0H10DRAFT_1947756 [Mycena sp. CBHHK59/15]
MSEIAKMQRNVTKQHEELMALLAAHPELTNSDHTSSVTGTLSSLSNSSGSFLMLPPSPQIFYGRESELQDIVNILKQESARIAILGPGGMGKTSLATAALHHPDVEAKYSYRYFISCHSTATCGDLASSIASHIGLEKGSNLSRKIVHHFSYSPPSLLVLDNFETPWESPASRLEVENFLSLLADISHLAILTFIDIADDNHEESSVRQLLNLTGNVPLAINLMASVAAYEGCDSTLARWKTQSTLILSDGYDKKSSLDISIMLSFSSAGMTLEAQRLLQILSMLPDGLTDTDLIQMQLPIPNILAAKTTLLRTALAYVGKDQRLKALVPIREHIYNSHPPSAELKLSLCQHFHKLLDLWKSYNSFLTGDIVDHISVNLGNLKTVLLDAISFENPDTVTNLQSIITLDDFCYKTNHASSLMLNLSEQMMHWQKHPIYGNYIIQTFERSFYLDLLDADKQIVLGNQYFNSRSELEQAKWYYALAFHYRSKRNDQVKALEFYEQALWLTALEVQPQWAYAEKALQYAEHLGNLVGQAWALYAQASCTRALGNFKDARRLCTHARDLLATCGLQGGTLDLQLQNEEAEIHLLKTEYLDAQNIFASTACNAAEGQPPTYTTTLSMLNLAVIGLATGADTEVVHHNLNMCRHLFSTSVALPLGVLYCDITMAGLHLQKGNLALANQMFQDCFLSVQNMTEEGTIFCLEQLADLTTHMNSPQVTLQWAAIFLASAQRTRNKLAVMKALYCLGTIFAGQGENSAALSLFQVALDGFTFMDVHKGRANCMVHVASIIEQQGDIAKAMELWRAAKPLFQRSSQAQEVAWLDTKITAVDSGVIGQKLA